MNDLSVMKFKMFENLSVLVDHVVYTDQVSDPPLRPYGFVYFITISNQTPHSIKLLARKWIVEESNGETTVVEGEGIVGEKPLLLPGEKFSYNSCHVTGSKAKARGAFYGVIEGSKTQIMVEIPEFLMNLPEKENNEYEF